MKIPNPLNHKQDILAILIVVVVALLVLKANEDNLHAYFRPSPKLKQLKQEEDILKLPKATYNSGYGDHECYYDSWDDENVCNPATVQISYKDGGKEDFLNQKMTSNGWQHLKFKPDPHEGEEFYERANYYTKDTPAGKLCGMVRVLHNREYPKDVFWLAEVNMYGPTNLNGCGYTTY